MAFHPLTQRHVGGFLLSLGLVALLAGCEDGPSRVAGPNYSLDGDAGTQCKDEGCACAPGTEPESCLLGTPIIRGNQYLCQRGTRVCREGTWSACENITLYAPSGEKLLGSFGALEACRPDDFTNTSTPNQSDLGTLNGTNVTYTTIPTPGVTIVQVPSGTIPNYGLGADNDGDGVPDAVGIDDCLNDPLHWRTPCTGPISEQGFFHILLPGQTAQDPMHVDLTVRSVDSYILIDTTKSMDGEIANLRSGLSGLMSNIRTVIPDAYLGLGVYRDLPVYADSNMNDLPFMHLLDPTSSLTTAQSVVSEVVNIDGNYFWPEAGANALYSVATGQGMGRWLPNRTCSNGGSGYPCFRPGTVPVVIMVTDAPSWGSASGLAYAPYPGTAGTTSTAGVSLPRATTVSSTGQGIRSNDTEATSFNLGDLTNSSVTVIGSNDGVTTPLANDFNATCGGRTLNGPDVFYTFTISDYRNFVFESFGDFDPAMWLRRVPSSGATTNLACDLDTGRLNDADGTAVWRTGARITSSTIPGTGASTTTDVTFSGCQGAPSSTTMTMTGCNVASTTTNADLTGCSVPTRTDSANFSNCTVPSTQTRLTNCTVPTMSTTQLSGCAMNTNTTSGFSGCTTPTATLTGTLTGCTAAATTASTVNTDSCSVYSTTDSASFSGCSVASSTPTAVYTGCATVSRSPELTGCDVRFGSSSNTNNLIFSNCTLSSGRTQLRCDRTTCTNGGSSCADSNSRDIEYMFVSGTGIPANTIVASQDYYGNGNRYEINLSSAVPAGNSVGSTITVLRARSLRDCAKEYSTDSDPSVGHVSTGDSRLATSGSSNTIAQAVSYSSGTKWAILYQNDLGSSGTDIADITSAAGVNQIECTGVQSGATVTPAAGMDISGTNIVAGSTISSLCLNGGCVSGRHVFRPNTAVPASIGSTVTVTGSGTLYGNVATCTGLTGTLPTSALTWTISNGTTGITNGTRISSVSGTYSLTLSANATGPIASTIAATSSSYRTNRVDCYRLESANPNGTIPIAGATISNSYSMPTGTVIGSVTSLGGDDYTYYLYTSAGAQYIPPASIDESPYDFTVNNPAVSTTVTCTGSTGSPPASGAAVTGTNIRSGTTINGNPTASGSGYTVVLTQAPTATSVGTISHSYTGPDRSRLTCNLAGGAVVPEATWTLAGTGLGASPTISSIASNGGNSYTITMSPSATTNTAQITSATGIDRRIFNNCTVTSGSTPLVNDMLGGMFLPASPTISAITVPDGMGRFTITMNGAATSASAVLTSATNNTPQPRLLRGCTLTAGDTVPAAGMLVTGTLLPVAGANIVSATPSGALYDVTINADATGFGVTTATNTQFSTNEIICDVSGVAQTANPASAATSLPSTTFTYANMPVTGSNLGGATTITAASAVTTTRYRFTVSPTFSSSTAALTSGARTYSFPTLLTGCMLSSGSLVANMGLTGTLLAANTTVSSFTPASGTGPYTITLSQNATGTGATTASGALSTPLPQLTGCQGSGVLADGLEITGAPVVAGSTITSFGGLGTAVDPWTINLSATPTTVGTNLTLGALVPGPTNRLTGCMIATGGPVVGPATTPTAHPGMTMSGALIAGGSTIASYTGTGTGPYDIVLDTNLLGVGATDASGTITLATGTGSLMFGATGMPPGTYQLVVDSTSYNAPDASSAGRGMFQLRVTNQSATASASLATTARTDPSWTSATAAMTSAGIRTIGIASCPMSCTDLDAKQTAYETCVQGSPATNTGAAAADRIGITTSRCGAAYARCITEFGAGATTNCTTMFTECRNSEIGAGKQSLNVATLSCTTAASACNRLNSGQTTRCAAVQSACSAAANVCTTQYNAVSACLATAGTGIGDDYRFCDETRADLSAMGTATSSVRADGTPFVYQISPNGSGLTATIADAVRELAQYILFDVTAQCEPAGSLACTGLFRNALVGTPNPVGLTPGCTSCTGPTCFRCNPGTAIGYNINFENSGVPRSSVPQIFDFDIVLRDQNGLEMSRAPVRIVVPPDEVVTYPASGSFEQIYDAHLPEEIPGQPAPTIGCDYPGRRADWGNFAYTAVVPAGTSIAFQFRTADTIAGLATAPAVTHTITADATNAIFDVGAAFDAAAASNPAISNYKPYMSVTTVLYSSAARTAAPTIQTYTAEYVCVDVE